MKVIEILSESSKSFEDAITEGVKRAAKSVDGITSAYVREQSVTVDGKGKISQYRVNLKVTFEVKGGREMD